MEKTLQPSEFRILSRCFTACSENRELDAQELNRFESLLESTSTHGLYDLGTAILIVSQDKKSAFTAKQMYEVLSYCYQSLLDIEILSKLEQETLECEVAEMEKRNSRCTEMIRKQIMLLQEYTSH